METTMMTTYDEDDRHLIGERLAEHLEATLPASDRRPPGDSGAYHRLPPIDDVKYFCSQCEVSYPGGRCPRCDARSELPPRSAIADEYLAEYDKSVVEREKSLAEYEQQIAEDEKAAARSRPHRDAIARLLDNARPRISLLTVVWEALAHELAEARGRAEKLGCCWDPQTCFYDACHHCAHCLDADEDRSLHLDGARELAYRQALVQAKLLPELIVHMAREHVRLDLSDADDEELRRSTEPRLTQLKAHITRAANHERAKRY